jgi:hypothetical protein
LQISDLKFALCNLESGIRDLPTGFWRKTKSPLTWDASAGRDSYESWLWLGKASRRRVVRVMMMAVVAMLEHD